MQRARQRRGHGPDRRTVVKDLVSFMSAWALIWFLALYGVDGPISWGLLGVAGALLGVPGAGEILNRSRAGQDGTDESVSSSPLSASLPSSLSPSSGEVPDATGDQDR